MLYLKLWHGHRDPDEQLNGWGEDGPIFGPFAFFHMTYGCEIKFGDAHCLTFVEDFVFYDGMFYGDWSFFDQMDDSMSSRLIGFDPVKAVRADRLPGTEQLCHVSKEGGDSTKGGHIMDPQRAWQELMEAFHQLDWDRVRDLSEGLLQWMSRGGLSPDTSAPVAAPAGHSTEQAGEAGLQTMPRPSLGPEWHRTVAQAACRYALDLAVQVLEDADGIPRGVPFSLSCCDCDIDSPQSYEEAIAAGWNRIQFEPQSPGENFLGLCPDCQQLSESIN